eukprot:PhM_4_TR15628/c1_g1_i1/m.10708/K14791/PWP1; periodic tryptophan protein 1
MVNMISGVAWVPVSACRAVPIHEDPDVVSEAMRNLRLHGAENEHSDDENETRNNNPLADGDEALVGLNDDDNWEGEMDSDDGSDAEDDVLQPTDLVCMAAHVCEDPYPAVEMFVYDQKSDGLYVHHDVMLPAMPLSIAWLGQLDGASANLAAVGDTDCAVSLWNLDMKSAVRSTATFGGYIEKKAKKKGARGSARGRGLELAPDSHSDAVLSVKWNVAAGQFLGSASADGTIKIWDVNNGTCVQTRSDVHVEKVQTIDWNPTEAFLLLSGAFDNTVCINDCREDSRALRCDVPCTPEQVAWIDSNTFAVSLTNGSLCAFDARNVSAGPTAELHAHSGNTVFAFSPHHQGLVASGGADGIVKLWDVRHGGAKVISGRELGVGEVFGMAFHPNTPDVLAAGGSNDKLLVYTVTDDLSRVGFT